MFVSCLFGNVCDLIVPAHPCKVLFATLTPNTNNKTRLSKSDSIMNPIKSARLGLEQFFASDANHGDVSERQTLW